MVRGFLIGSHFKGILNLLLLLCTQDAVAL